MFLGKESNSIWVLYVWYIYLTFQKNFQLSGKYKTMLPRTSDFIFVNNLIFNGLWAFLFFMISWFLSQLRFSKKQTPKWNQRCKTHIGGNTCARWRGDGLGRGGESLLTTVQVWLWWKEGEKESSLNRQSFSLQCNSEKDLARLMGSPRAKTAYQSRCQASASVYTYSSLNKQVMGTNFANKIQLKSWPFYWGKLKSL